MGNPLDLLLYVAGLFHAGIGLTIVLESLVGPGLGRWAWFALLTSLALFDGLWLLYFVQYTKSKEHRYIPHRRPSSPPPPLPGSSSGSYFWPLGYSTWRFSCRLSW